MIKKDYSGHEVAVSHDDVADQFVIAIDGRYVGRAVTINGVKKVIADQLGDPAAEKLQPISQAMRDARILKGLSISELAEKSHVSASNISAYERGFRCPGIYMVADLADALGISIDEYIGRSQWT